MASQRILAAFETRLAKLAADLIAETEPSAEDRAHLLLVAHLAQGVIKSYGSHQLDLAAAMEAAKGGLTGSSAQQRVLNVSLRRLVDDNLMTPWYARFLNSNLGMKRTIIISGGPKVGKSTLLNALIDLLPRDHRIVTIDDTDEGLPTLRDRSFTVHLKAKRGTPARAAVFRRAREMKPTWVVAGELVRRDGPGFLQSLTAGTTGGLTTVQTMDPEATLNDWLAMNKPVAEHLKQLNPLVVHLELVAEGAPRVERVIEVTTDRGNLVVTRREQVDSEQVGVQGGERSPLAKSERDSELARRS
ncbi:MAG: Flp pilus assembly complex ATPase component TadA [Actinobacteria bacterium]|jgi:Flp pilus assembly CpaF family ATPase|nr:Flp pilus assembly complex ATPase component TadA [Actinomycetota bacterium]